jgi:hypothetical protein
MAGHDTWPFSPPTRSVYIHARTTRRGVDHRVKPGDDEYLAVAV